MRETDALRFLILAIATWRVSHMITREAGPFDVFKRLRERLPLGGLTSCIWCASVWVAAAFVIVYALIHPVALADGLILVPAVSGAALAFASWTGVHHLP